MDYDRTKNDNSLTSPKIFTGIVISSDGPSYNCIVGAHDQYDTLSQLQGVALSSAFANMFGFKECLVPQPGSKVVCLQTNPTQCLILGVIPDVDAGYAEFPSRALHSKGADDADYVGWTTDPAKLDMHNQGRPTDVNDQEHVIMNEFGVMLGLFQQLAVLRGSELAQVQCFLMDDLVRIVSHNFQHYTAIGEHNVYHDGKALLAEFGATHIPAETYGRPCIDSESQAPMFQKTDTGDGYELIVPDAQAIQRFRWFLGRLGDFLHIFLSRPADDVVRKLDPSSEDKPDTGLFDIHIGTDGGFHLRSAKEVFIEHANWIRVPQRKASPEDPKGDKAEDIEYEDKENYEFSNNYSYKDNPTFYALQMRNYVAYVTEKQAYQNFNKHEKDFKVEKNPGGATKVSEIDKIDPNTPCNLRDWKLRMSGMYLMPNGGFMIRDAWGSGIVSDGGNIYLQPAKDLIFQPARNLVAKVGQFASIAAKKDIDLSSTEKGVRIKAEKAMYLYSHTSGIVVQSDAEEPSTGSPDPATEAIEELGGVVLKSKQGIYQYAEAKPILLFSKDKLIFKSSSDIWTKSDQNIYTIAGQNCFMNYQTGIFRGTQLSALVSDQTVITAGTSSTVFGQKDTYLGVQYDDKSPFVDPLKGTIEVSTITQSLDQITSQDVLQQADPFTDESKLQDLKFNFLNSDKYNLNDEDALPMTLPQQEDLLTSNYNYSTWSEKDVNGSKPYPGADKWGSFFASAQTPPNLQVYDGKDYCGKADSSSASMEITLSSLDQYKILDN